VVGRTRRGGAPLVREKYDVKRWVAYRQQSGRASRALFVVEARSEREALCLASDVVLQLDQEESAARGSWSGPLVHVRLADEVPERDLADLVRRVATSN
jgi:hypothetical protein